MNSFMKYFTAALASVLVAGGLVVLAAASRDVPAATGSVVKITVTTEQGEAHGSGVYLGHGYILTAAHVADVLTADAVVKDESGGIHKGIVVLWKNTDYDMALLRLPDAEARQMTPAALSCDVPPVNTPVHAIGNPLEVEFATMRGTVASGPINLGRWHSVIATDMTTVPGMSGGPLFNEEGEVVGIVVGTTVGYTTMGYVVPASVFCMLTDRV